MFIIRRAGRRALLVGVLIAIGGSIGALLDGDGQGWLAAGLAVLVVPAAVAAGRRGGAWEAWARLAYASLLQASFLYLVYAAWVVEATSGGAIGWTVGALMWLLQLASLVVTLSFAYEIFDVLGRRRFPAHAAATAVAEPSRWPSVCIQIPAYNEPPELLAKTIQQVMRQEYPGRWMVQVIDNNTPDEATWRPIAALCASLGERVEFMHLADWPGFKAGALNEATRRLPRWVEAIAVVDADYLVEPGFLKATARHLANPRVAFVQTPQHYREWADDRYLAGVFHQFKYFFDVAMPSRHERNAIIFGGTMGLIRRDALEAIGGWDEWCLTEDAEASLRLLGAGWSGVYDPTCYGAGLMPLSFDGLKKQRFRWAFGGIQILRKHAAGLLLGNTDATRHMSAAQRLAYLLGGLQWGNELLNLLFTALLILTAGTVVAGGHLGLPEVTGGVLCVPPLLIITGVARTQWALRRTAGCSRREALRAQLVFFALSWVVARACVAAVLRSSGTFLRTPKTRGTRAWQRALRASTAETALALACLGGGSLLVVSRPAPVTAVLAALLLGQGIIYGSAPLCGVSAEGIRLTATRAAFARSAQNTGQRPLRRVALRAGLSVGLAVAGGLAALLVVSAPRGAPFPGISTGPPLGGLVGPGQGAAAPAPPLPSGSATASAAVVAATQTPGATRRTAPQPTASGLLSASPSPTSASTTTPRPASPSPNPRPSPTLTPQPSGRPSSSPTPRGSPPPHPTPTP